MSTGADTGHQHVDPSELVEELTGQRCIGIDVVRVVVLIRAPRPGAGGHDLANLASAGFLPSADRIRLGNQDQLGAVGTQHLLHHSRIGHQHDRVVVDDPGQGQTQAQGAAGGLYDRRPRAQVSRARARSTMCIPGRSLIATGIAALQLRPEPTTRPAGGVGHPQQRCVADQARQAVGRGFGSGQVLRVGSAREPAGRESRARKDIVGSVGTGGRVHE